MICEIGCGDQQKALNSNVHEKQITREQKFSKESGFIFRGLEIKAE